LRAKIAAPPTQKASARLWVKRLSREIFGIPAYAISLCWWRWRDR